MIKLVSMLGRCSTIHVATHRPIGVNLLFDTALRWFPNPRILAVGQYPALCQTAALIQCSAAALQQSLRGRLEGQ